MFMKKKKKSIADTRRLDFNTSLKFIKKKKPYVLYKATTNNNNNISRIYACTKERERKEQIARGNLVQSIFKFIPGLSRYSSYRYINPRV